MNRRYVFLLVLFLVVCLGTTGCKTNTEKLPSGIEEIPTLAFTNIPTATLLPTQTPLPTSTPNYTPTPRPSNNEIVVLHGFAVNPSVTCGDLHCIMYEKESLQFTILMYENGMAVFGIYYPVSQESGEFAELISLLTDLYGPEIPSWVTDQINQDAFIVEVLNTAVVDGHSLNLGITDLTDQKQSLNLILDPPNQD